MEVGLVTFALYMQAFLNSQKFMSDSVKEFKKYRVAALVLTYNEDPNTVSETISSVKEALGDLGDVYLLDDSTKEDVVKMNKEICSKMNANYIHRDNRRGYKAGAINDFLKSRSKEYDIIAIFDVDQRPIKTFFIDLLPLFTDPDVAFVQVPQAYTQLLSRVSIGALTQLRPFLDVVMEGRSARGSAFILGTGVLIRRESLEKVGLFDESVVTEDLATSINIHSYGLKSIYVNYPGIWYGEAPTTVDSYLVQQGRWALGGFQTISKILKANVGPKIFLDYFSGFLYWLKEGPLTIIEIAAPIIFLLFHIFILKINPLLFALAYYPLFIVSIVLFIYTMKNNEYGVKGFWYHQFIELIMMPAVTLSFVSWITKRKRPFKVTPKGRQGKISYSIIYNIIVLFVLLISFYEGILWLLKSENYLLKYSIIVNLSWIAYFVLLDAGTFLIHLSKIENEEELINENIR